MMKKLFPISVIVLVLIILWLFVRFVIGGPEDDWICVNGQWVKHGAPATPMPTEACGQNKISSFEDCLAAGNPVMESYPRQCKAGDKTFTEDIGNELEKIDLIQVSNPRPNQTITSPLTITGQARGTWFFEASFPIELLNKEGEILAQTIATAQSDWMTTNFVPFEATLEFSAKEGSQGQLIFEKDNPSGLPENDDWLHMPVTFGKPQTTTIKVFFNNDNLDPEFSCNKVFPIERQIPKTQAVARAALEELLKGPLPAEKTDGFFSNINPGVKIQSLTLENGTAKVDFDQQLEFQVGGSCRVAAIRAEITQTLKQFPTVKNVIISIDGRTEDILQP